MTLYTHYAVTSAIVCAVKFVNSFARCQHQFYITKLINIDSSILSYPAVLFLFQYHPEC